MSNDVMQAVGVFFSYAVLAIFAQNAVFTRGLGVSRLVQLVGDERTSSGWFALLLCVTQVLVAPLAFYAGGFAAAQPNFAQLRPLVCGQSRQGSAYRKRCCQQGRCHFREPSHDKLSSFPFCRSDIGSIRASTTVRASVYSPEQVAIARNCAPSGSSSSARRACASI